MNLKDALELAGVDYEMTLNRFSNNAMLLERFVKKFPNDKTFEELDAAVGDKRYGDVERSAHTLKGIASNLGFQYLSDLSAEVVILSDPIITTRTISELPFPEWQKNTKKLFPV